MNKQKSEVPILIWVLFLIPVIWAAVLAAQSAEHADTIFEIAANFTEVLRAPFSLRWTEDTIKFIFIFLLAYSLGVGLYLSGKQNKRPGEEHGSAEWGNVKTICAKYINRKNPLENLILTQNFRIGLDGRKHRRNLNVLVVGGSGSGKTRYYAKPNALQANTSFVFCDPKGELLRDTGSLLEAKGYDVRVFDLIQPEKSLCFNPFAYVRSDLDVLRLCTNLIDNTTPKGASSGDPFWTKSETALLQALMLYLLHEAPAEEQNFAMVMELLSCAEVREEDDAYLSILDILFEQLEMEKPGHIAVKQYSIYKQAAGKTAKSILVSIAVRLAYFNISEIALLTSTDELGLKDLGEKKTALYLLIPDNDTSINFIIGMIYTSAIQELYYQADRVHDGRLPVPVHFCMDEFANVSLPNDFDKVLATARSRLISFSIIIQNISQLKALFKKEWESLIGNCDEFVYLGGNENETHKLVSGMLGKSTLSTVTHNETKGKTGSYSTNEQLTGRELLTPDEVRLLDNDYVLLFIRGERPIMDRKYDILKHPNIALTTDGGQPPYRHGRLTLAKEDVNIDLNHLGEYELLTVEQMEEELNAEEGK